MIMVPKHSKILVFLLIALVVAASTFAANVYVCDTSVCGNTPTAPYDTWEKALDDFPATLTRGNTYYSAEGNYSAYDFDDACSDTPVAGCDETDRITVKKCGSGDGICENAAGYNAVHHDGQTVFATTLAISGSYFTIDGNTTDWNPTIKINGNSATSYYLNITGNNVLVKGVYAYGDGNQDLERKCISIQGTNTVTVQNVEASHTAGDCVGISNSTGITVDKLYCHDRITGGDAHGDAFELFSSSNVTISNSKVHWQGQHIYWGGAVGTEQSAFTIYGNVLWATGESNGGKCFHWNGDCTLSGVVAYNNTCVNVTTQLTNADGTYTNNLWYPGAAINISTGTHSKGWYKSGMTVTDATKQEGDSSIFANYSGEDFRLSGATNVGSNIGTPAGAGTDLLGSTRGTDGVWDRGAYEYIAPPTYLPWRLN